MRHTSGQAAGNICTGRLRGETFAIQARVTDLTGGVRASSGLRAALAQRYAHLSQPQGGVPDVNLPLHPSRAHARATFSKGAGRTTCSS